MHTLILGGGVFVGRHLVEAALAAGHHVSTFSRGKTQPGLFPQVEHLYGDRDGNLGALTGKRWDLVIDTCGFIPRVVAQSVGISCERYIFISSVSVYANLRAVPDETSALHPAPQHEDVTAGYGGLKAACEQVVRTALGPLATVVRPGLIGGPHDPTGRFTYWPVRLSEGGKVLAPEPRGAACQVLDARDLAEFCLRLAEDDRPGTFNVTGESRSMERFLAEVTAGVGAQVELTWVSPEALAGVAPWSELPLWLPDPEYVGMAAISSSRALAAGLRRRALADTAKDTLDWARSLPGEPPRQADGRYQPATLTREREAELLMQAARSTTLARGKFG